MKYLSQCLAWRQRLVRLHLLAEHQHQQAVLGDGQRQVPHRVAAPAVGARQAHGQVGIGPGSRLRVQQIELAPGLQPDVGAVWSHAATLRATSTSFQSLWPPGGSRR